MTRLSIREVSQLAGRCFAAAGLPDGLAEANAEAVWWTEVYKERGITTLHRLLDDLPDWDRSAVSLEKQGSMISAVDADDQPSLVSGAAVLDMSCAQADSHGYGITSATIPSGDPTIETIGHLAYRAAKRGYISILLYADAEGESGTVLGTPEQPLPLLAETTLDAPSVSYDEILNLVDSDAYRYSNYPMMQVFFDRDEENRYSTAETRLLSRLLRRSIVPAAESRFATESGYVVICVDPRYPRYPDEVQHIVERFIADHDTDLTAVFDPDEISERTGRLTREGVEVDDAVWRDVFDFSSGVLAPPFEGSEADAGFELS